MSSKYDEPRAEVCRYSKLMAEAGWVVNSAGNVSVRAPGEDEVYVITPTSVKYAEMAPENVVVCDGEGEALIELDNAPSFELPLHVAIYRARADVSAIFHTHATSSAILSVLRKSLPPIVEEMVPYLGGEVLCGGYGASGSEELAQAAVAALGDRAAAFVANHGNVCVGKTLEKAFAAAALLERVATIYVEALKLAAATGGKVYQLPDEVVAVEREMYEVLIGGY